MIWEIREATLSCIAFHLGRTGGSGRCCGLRPRRYASRMGASISLSSLEICVAAADSCLQLLVGPGASTQVQAVHGQVLAWP